MYAIGCFFPCSAACLATEEYTLALKRKRLGRQGAKGAGAHNKLFLELPRKQYQDVWMYTWSMRKENTFKISKTMAR